MFYSGQLRVDGLLNMPLVQSLQRFWHSGWGLDALYDRLFVRPYYALAALLKGEPVDAVYGLIVTINQTLNGWLATGQSGQMRRYLISMVFGLIVVLAIMLGTL